MKRGPSGAAGAFIHGGPRREAGARAGPPGPEENERANAALDHLPAGRIIISTTKVLCGHEIDEDVHELMSQPLDVRSMNTPA